MGSIREHTVFEVYLRGLGYRYFFPLPMTPYLTQHSKTAKQTNNFSSISPIGVAIQ